METTQEDAISLDFVVHHVTVLSCPVHEVEGWGSDLLQAENAG